MPYVAPVVSTRRKKTFSSKNSQPTARRSARSARVARVAVGELAASRIIYKRVLFTPSPIWEIGKPIAVAKGAYRRDAERHAGEESRAAESVAVTRIGGSG